MRRGREKAATAAAAAAAAAAGQHGTELPELLLEVSVSSLGAYLPAAAAAAAQPGGGGGQAGAGGSGCCVWSPRHQQWVLLLAPRKRQQSTKTGKLDETIELDDVRLPDLGPVLHWLAQQRLRINGLRDDDGSVSMWGLKLGELLVVWLSYYIDSFL